MIFFLVMPGLFGGFGNYFIPIYIGSSEIIYPRINNFSILILFLSYLLIILSIILEFGSGTGWTLYPPLSTSFMNLSPSGGQCFTNNYQRDFGYRKRRIEIYYNPFRYFS